MTKDEIKALLDQLFEAAGDKEINGVVIALSAKENDNQSKLGVSIHMKSSGIRNLMQSLMGAIQRQQHPVEKMLGDVISGIGDKIPREGESFEAYVERRNSEILGADGNQGIEALLRNILSKDQNDTTPDFKEKALEAREKGLTIDQFIESLLQDK